LAAANTAGGKGGIADALTGFGDFLAGLAFVFVNRHDGNSLILGTGCSAGAWYQPAAAASGWMSRAKKLGYFEQ